MSEHRLNICPRCKRAEKYLTWSYCKECSRIVRAESKANQKPEGRQYEHNESRPDGPAKVFYDATLKTLQEKYDVKDAELRKNGYDPAVISALKTLQEKYDVKDAELRKNGYDPAIISAGLADEL